MRSDFVIFLSDCFYDFFSFAVSLVSSFIMITKYKVKAKAYPFWIRENLFFIGRGGGEGVEGGAVVGRGLAVLLQIFKLKYHPVSVGMITFTLTHW